MDAEGRAGARLAVEQEAAAAAERRAEIGRDRAALVESRPEREAAVAAHRAAVERGTERLGAREAVDRAVSEAAARRTAAEAAAARAVEAETAARAHREAQERRREAAERHVGLLRARYEQAASELAERLVPGEPCAVCGSPEHPAPAATADTAVRDEAGRLVRTTVHSVLLTIDPRAAYATLADVSRWPFTFGPTVHVAREDAGPGRELLDVWAMAHGEVRHWTSRRELDEADLTIRFRQEASPAPLASMGGRWTVHRLGDGMCRVVLDHDYTLLDDGPGVDEADLAEVDAYVEQAGLHGKVSTREDADGLAIEFKDALLFDSASAELRSEGAGTLEAVARKIAELPTRSVLIEGHTDDVPISTPRFASNWELSSQRAINVVKLLIEEGVPANRLAATGFGEFQPLDGPGGLARNRRIELRLTDR